jgi:hypothetical protein
MLMLVASIALALAWGIDSALADGLQIPGSPTASPSQTATQSNDASNSANQTATSAPIVVSGPNVAIANGGTGKSECSPCGSSSGTVNQDSGNTVDASTTNNAQQANTQSNEAGQSQTVSATGCCDGKGKQSGTSQSADQSNSGSNKANQTATSAPVVVSGPNIAALNSGDVNQNSGNNVNASASNSADQSNTQSNEADQSQTVSAHGCCHGKQGGASQSADQSNSASNEATQTATSAPVVVSGPNIAAFNGGDVNQNSGNNVDASASNNADQSNTQSNSLTQHQLIRGGGFCCSKAGSEQTATQSNSGSNEAKQSATSAPHVVSGGNFAIGKPCKGGRGGDVRQNSGNDVDASSSNNAEQENDQSNTLEQRQSVDRGSECCECKPRCGSSRCECSRT